ncbi:Mechanosensitive ion channel protein 8 [Picochlorum sp. SENEW3]|nr:Mechanosensitive ion channel protein 8 [Picochlorum sp. SENEW3]WPT17294.1 Mechanosensitive ion channel protein 8 [Picochlorum sp. SENEW3]
MGDTEVQGEHGHKAPHPVPAGTRTRSRPPDAVATEVGSSKVWSEVASLGRSEGYGSRASRFADEASSDEDDAQAAADLLSMSRDDMLWASDDEAVEEELRAQRKLPWYRRRRVHIWLVIVCAQVGLLCGAIYHAVDQGLESKFREWRLLFFLASLPVAWVLGTFCTWVMIKFVEKIFLTSTNALYYTYASRKWVKWLLRSTFVLIFWACFMLIGSSNESQAVQITCDIILKILGCVSLFLLAVLLTCLLVKSLSMTYLGRNQRARMETSLKQEHLLSVLMGPRPSRSITGTLDSRLDSAVQFLRGTSLGHQEEARRMEEAGSPLSRDVAEDGALKRISERDDSGQSREEAMLPIAIDLSETHEGTPPPVEGGRSRWRVSSLWQWLPRPAPKVDQPSIRGTRSGRGGKSKVRAAGRQGSALSRAQDLERLYRLERHMRKKQMRLTFRDELNQVHERSTIDERSVRQMAAFLFWNITQSVDAHSICQEDLAVFFKEQGDVDLSFRMLDVNGDGEITREDCRDAVEKIHQDRCNLAATLQDTKSITKALEILLGIIIHTIFFFFYLLIFQAHVSQIWLGFTGLLAVLSLIFRNTAASVFSNLIFLFGSHPYDVGDFVLIDSVKYKVMEVRLNFTRLSRRSSSRTCWYANEEMQLVMLCNLSRSKNWIYELNVAVNRDIDSSILEKMRNGLETVMQENSGEFGELLLLVFKEMTDPAKIRIYGLVELSHQGCSTSRRYTAGSLLYQGVFRVFQENNVQYTMPDSKTELLLPSRPGASP